MGKTVRLKDGSEVVVRPLTKDDFDASLAFFRALPKEDVDYLRGDPTQREMLEARFQEMESGQYDRLVAVAGDTIVAEGTLEMTGRDWTSHVGELRLIVAEDYRRKGLGMLMAHEVYSLAARYRLEKIMVTIMRPQVAARNIFRKLGFREELVLREHVRDRKGRAQDLILMRCDLEALWKELEGFEGRGGPARGE
jgi:RimJ/RimL family protein N-acetyltransferase